MSTTKVKAQAYLDQYIDLFEEPGAQRIMAIDELYRTVAEVQRFLVIFPVGKNQRVKRIRERLTQHLSETLSLANGTAGRASPRRIDEAPISQGAKAYWKSLWADRNPWSNYISDASEAETGLSANNLALRHELFKDNWFCLADVDRDISNPLVYMHLHWDGLPCLLNIFTEQT